jgi:histidinol-phosphatase (PHP family)
LIVDLHNHTYRCNHATGTPIEYFNKSKEIGIDIYGFSDHAPMDFDTFYRMKFDDMIDYEREIRETGALVGYEVDFGDTFIDDRVINAKVDYLIGSIHFINEWGFDNPAFIGEYKNKNIDEIWEEYFFAITKMAKTSLFDIVGHFDLMKVFNFLPKKDIRILAQDAIKAIKKSNMVLEINSSGFRKAPKEQYPSREILEIVYEYDIPITFGSDAHSVEQVGSGLLDAIELAKSIGFTKCAYFREREVIFTDIV